MIMLREKWHFGWDLWLFVTYMARIHTFFTMMRIIFCTIYDWFGFRFVVNFLPHSIRNFHQVRASVCVRQGFLHTKQMINIWFVFSRLNLGATKSFAGTFEIFISWCYNYNINAKKLVSLVGVLFSTNKSFSAEKRCKHTTKDFIKTHTHTHYFQHMRKTTRKKVWWQAKKYMIACITNRFTSFFCSQHL